ncbi:hypothetical protein AXF42_Ash006090 [Apostasia shenzhenica]|uniref:Uncharacterized protein n=1 Tax=Apostasia shenzhenica TaxID=1088818 RepID=A0A2I0B077_9ASPA|nr:hypothetical protein AXF42_Ash006090 [Apostasia shenzhenica]
MRNMIKDSVWKNTEDEILNGLGFLIRSWYEWLEPSIKKDFQRMLRGVHQSKFYSSPAVFQESEYLLAAVSSPSVAPCGVPCLLAASACCKLTKYTYNKKMIHRLHPNQRIPRDFEEAPRLPHEIVEEAEGGSDSEEHQRAVHPLQSDLAINSSDFVDKPSDNEEYQDDVKEFQDNVEEFNYKHGSDVSIMDSLCLRPQILGDPERREAKSQELIAGDEQHADAPQNPSPPQPLPLRKPRSFLKVPRNPPIRMQTMNHFLIVKDILLRLHVASYFAYICSYIFLLNSLFLEI